MAPRRSATSQPAKAAKLEKATTTPPTAAAARPAAPRPDPSATFQLVLRAIEFLVLAAVYSPISQLSLSPVYGSTPPIRHHARLTMGAALVAFLGQRSMKNRIPKNATDYLPVYAFLVPSIQFFLFQYSGDMGPVYGPLVTELLTYFPVVVMSLYAAAMAVESIDLTGYGERVQGSGPAVASYLFFSASQRLMTSYLRKNIGSSLVFTRTTLQFIVASFYALLLPSRALIFVVLPILHSASLNVHVPLRHTTAALNTTLHTYNYSLVARQESLTGYISVLDNLKDNFRVMRCDHSLLGGEWTFSHLYEGKVAEPIYSVFTLLEAVRLVEPNLDQKPTIPDDQTNALVIGLGIGTTPSALIAHGIHTTIVEIDPVVHDFAMKFFALPTNHTSIIEDAALFVERARTAGPEHTTYDYIIHDVFTGGVEPADLFTQEFLQGLSDLLKPDGVIAINYAGDLLLPPARLIVATILSVFPSCRLFREDIPVPPSPSASSPPVQDIKDFTNIVLFCRKSPGPFAFRAVTDADTLGSPSRRYHLQPRHEVEAGFFAAREGEVEGRVLRRGKTGVLERWQQESAEGHWRIMRGVVEGGVWENCHSKGSHQSSKRPLRLLIAIIPVYLDSYITISTLSNQPPDKRPVTIHVYASEASRISVAERFHRDASPPLPFEPEVPAPRPVAALRRDAVSPSLPTEPHSPHVSPRIALPPTPPALLLGVSVPLPRAVRRAIAPRQDEAEWSRAAVF